MASKTYPISEFLHTIDVEKIHRVRGTSIFMTGDPEGTPPALIHNVRHNKILHEQVILMTAKTEEIPYVAMNERVEVTEIGPKIFRVIVHYGFQETPNIKKILRHCEAKGITIEMNDLTFFVGRETLIATDRPGMAIWREKLFIGMSKNALNATSFFKIPSDKVIEVGLQVEM
jgi:KUP system potassium uptake protein